MTRLRLIARQGSLMTLTAMIVALALRLLVPAGYMPVFDSHGLTLTICTGHGAMTISAKSDAGKSDAGKPDTTKGELPCAFAGMAIAAIGGATPLIASAAVEWTALARSAAAFGTAVVLPGFLRPPLRAPPVPIS